MVFRIRRVPVPGRRADWPGSGFPSHYNAWWPQSMSKNKTQLRLQELLTSTIETLDTIQADATQLIAVSPVVCAQTGNRFITFSIFLHMLPAKAATRGSPLTMRKQGPMSQLALQPRGDYLEVQCSQWRELRRRLVGWAAVVHRRIRVVALLPPRIQPAQEGLLHRNRHKA